MKYTSIMYHKIEKLTTTKSSVTPSSFIEHVKLLKDLHVQSWTLNSVNESNSECLPCFITFDDGHRSNMFAAELLADNGLQGCFYVVKDFAQNNPDYLDEAEIKAIAHMGHLIGVHGKYHEWWTKSDDKTLVSDLKETKVWIEDMIGKPIITCSAVGGVISNGVINCIRANIPDMKYIRTSRWGICDVEDTLLNCIAIDRNCSIDSFRKIVMNDFMFYALGKVKYDVKEIIKPIYHFVKR